MSDPAERLHVVVSHARGLVLVLLVALAPWLDARGTRYTAAQVFGFYARESIASVEHTFTPQNEHVVFNAIYVRRNAVALGAVLAGSAALLLVPRRFARVPIAAASGICAGTLSVFVSSHLIIELYALGIRPRNEATWLFLTEVAAALPVVSVVVGTFLLARWNEWGVWPGGVAAFFCLFCPILAGPEIVGGARVVAVFAAITFWREARRWDEIPRPAE